MSAIENLTSNIVDYAGLFPPASLPLNKVAANFATYLESNMSWMLARLVVPTAKLHELEQLESFQASVACWRISALVPAADAPEDGLAVALKKIAEFNNRNSAGSNNGDAEPIAVVDSIEIRTPNVELLRQTIDAVPDGLEVFCELPHQEPLGPFLDQIERSGKSIRAKIRVGGVEAKLIPSPAEVGNFIEKCAAHDVGFKATAGLHHPLRGEYRLTYDPQPEHGQMFGFINVFAAACFAYCCEVPSEKLHDILTESDAAAFQFSADSMRWNDLSASAEQISKIRSNRAFSFGSCSFEEPTTELAELGWLSDVCGSTG